MIFVLTKLVRQIPTFVLTNLGHDLGLMKLLMQILTFVLTKLVRQILIYVLMKLGRQILMCFFFLNEIIQIILDLCL